MVLYEYHWRSCLFSALNLLCQILEKALYKVNVAIFTPPHSVRRESGAHKGAPRGAECRASGGRASCLRTSAALAGLTHTWTPKTRSASACRCTPATTAGYCCALARARRRGRATSLRLCSTASRAPRSPCATYSNCPRGRATCARWLSRSTLVRNKTQK